jgi:hypothetical protein
VLAFGTLGVHCSCTAAAAAAADAALMRWQDRSSTGKSAAASRGHRAPSPQSPKVGGSSSSTALREQQQLAGDSTQGQVSVMHRLSLAPETCAFDMLFAHQSMCKDDVGVLCGLHAAIKGAVC